MTGEVVILETMCFKHSKLRANTNNSTYKILADFPEAFPIFIECLFKQIGFRCGPFLHLISAEDWTTTRYKVLNGTDNVIITLMKSIHCMQLSHINTHHVTETQWAYVKNPKQLSDIIYQLHMMRQNWPMSTVDQKMFYKAVLWILIFNNDLISNLLPSMTVKEFCFQCFNTVDTRRCIQPVKTEWDVGMVICLHWSASDLHWPSWCQCYLCHLFLH